jgi:hypothetical protein
MTRFGLISVAVAGFASIALGCRKDPDPTHFRLRDFSTAPALRDTIRKLVPPGSHLTAVWEMMQGNGFKCGERPGIRVDPQTHKLGSGSPSLECWQSTRISLGLRRRVWTVTFPHDSSGVRDAFARYIIQP